MKKTIIVKVPATTANIGSGFDSFGAALELRNTLVAEFSRGGAVGRSVAPSIIIRGEGKGILPADARNLVWRSMKKVFAAAGEPAPSVRLTMINKIPLASGMGSSAAAVVGGLLAANEICYNKLPSEELIQIAAALEGHPDNAVPAFAGGFCVSFDENGRTGYVRLPLARSGMKAAVCVPEIDLPTERARGILPARVPMSDAVHNLSRAALMIAAIAGRAGREVMGIAVGDRLHQAVRMKHIPGAAEAFGAARKAGAYGVCVSGAGPSILALCPPSLARRAAGAMVLSFRRRAIKSRAFILNFTDSGASVESGSRRRVR